MKNFVLLVASIALLHSGDGQMIDDMIFANRTAQKTEDAFLRDSALLWNNGQVFYRFENLNGEPLFSKEDVSFIETILKEIQSQVPCISFSKVDTNFSGGHLIFTSAGDEDNPPNGCYSYVGCVGSQGGKNGQIINLGGPGCINRRVVTHEVLHSLGCTHEINRYDRTQFVDITENNIMTEKSKNFHQKDIVNYGTMSTPYDFGSIMHYPRDAFSTDGSDTIIPRSNKATIPRTNTLDDNRGMSIIDIVELSRNYGKHTNTMCLPTLEILNQYYQMENTEEEDVQIGKSACGGNQTLCDITGRYLTEVGTRVLAKRSLEQMVKDKNIPDNWMLNSIETDPRIGKKVIEHCSKKLKIEAPIVLKNKRKFWKSYLLREAFYKECLESFGVCRLERKGYDSVMNLKQFAKDFNKESTRQGTANIVGGVFQVVGGAIQAAGVLLAPLTAGSSLILTPVGSLVALPGSLISTLVAFGAAGWSEQKIKDSKVLIQKTEEELEILNYLLGLYIDSQLKRVEFFDQNQDFKTIEEHFIELTNQVTRSTPQSIANFIIPSSAIYTELIRGTKFILKSKELLSTMQTKIADSLRSTSLFTNTNEYLQEMLKRRKAIASKQLWQGKAIPRECKLGMGIGLGSSISMMNLGFGVFDIITGDRKLNSHSDIADTFTSTAKEINYILETTLEIYNDTMDKSDSDCSVENGNYRYLEVTKISMRSINGQGYSGTKVKLTSLNPMDDSEPGECLTDNLQVPRSNEAGGGFWFYLDYTNLGDCRYMQIYNNSAKIQIINDHSNAVEVDYVTISTESDFVPSHVCTRTGDLSSLNSSSLYDYNGCTGDKCHKELTCFQHQGLRMIKIKTCEQYYAGTDAAARLQIYQKDRDGELLPANDARQSYCTTEYLDNPGDDWEFGDVDTYRIDAMGECARPFHEDFKPEEGYLGLHVLGDVNNHWCTDALKLYVATEKPNQSRTFRCEVWGETGQGTWQHGPNKENICRLQKPNNRGLQKIRLHIPDYYYAASSGKLQIKLTKQDSTFCYTNILYKTYIGNTWIEIDGGGYEEKKNVMNDRLGMCEGFLIDGSSVQIQINKLDGNSVAFDSVHLHGGVGEDLVLSDDTPFITCSGKQIWAESGEVYIGTPNGGSWTYSSWLKWENASAAWDCHYNTYTTIKAIHFRLCDENTAGSESSFKAEFTNIDRNNCKKGKLCHCQTKELPLKGLDSNDFQSIYNLGGDCDSLQIFDNKVYFNLFNMDRTDSLCLNQIWVDISDSAGTTNQLKCKLNTKASKLIVIQEEGTRLPTLCE